MMKIFIIIVFCIAFARPASANDDAPIDRDINCNTFAEMAEIIIDAHQSYMPKHRITEIVSTTLSKQKTDIETEDILLKLYLGLIRAAYRESIQLSEERKQQSIDEFRDKFYMQCAEGIRNKYNFN